MFLTAEINESMQIAVKLRRVGRKGGSLRLLGGKKGNSVSVLPKSPKCCLNLNA